MIIANARTVFRREMEVSEVWKCTIRFVHKLVFHVEKLMNTVSFVDVDPTDIILSQYQSNYNQPVQHIWKSSEIWDRPTDIHGVRNRKPQFNSFFKNCASQFIQSFVVYITVYRQQPTGYVAHLPYCRMGTVSLSWGHIGWCVVLSIHQILAPWLKKVRSHNSNPPYGHYYLFLCKP